MKKLSTLFIASITVALLSLLGCNHQDVSNLQTTAQPQTIKQENDDKVSDADWKTQYKVISKVKFHILINEYLDNNDKDNPDTSILAREYWCFDGTGEWSQVYPVTCKIVLPKSSEIRSALDFKYQMKMANPSSLKLMENTIINDTVLSLWNEQNYDAVLEYSKESPKGLTYEMLEKSTR